MKLLSPKAEHSLSFIIILGCLCDLIYALSITWGFTTDDAYISWYYARQLIQGHGLLWHAAIPPVEGYSNFLWMLFAALIMQLRLPLVISIKIISCISLSAALFFLYRFSRLFFSPLLASMPLFLFSHYLGVAWWTMSGLESSFYCALSLLACWQCAVALGYKTVGRKADLHTRVKPHKGSLAWFISNIALLALSLTRFEGLIWSIPLLCFILAHYKEKRPSRKILRKQFICWFMITIFCFVLPYCLYFIWRLLYFGHLIPNTYQCKSSISGQAFVIDYDYFLIIGPLLILALPYLIYAKDCRHWLLWLPSLLYAVMLWQADPVIAEYLRFFLAPYAFFCILPVLGVYQFLSWFQLKIDAKLTTVLILIIATYWFIPGNDFTFLRKRVAHYQERTQNRVVIAQLLNEKAASGDKILITDCGLIPFLINKDMRFIDTQCLNNPFITQRPYKGHGALYAEHLMKDIKPEWILMNYYPPIQHGDYLTEVIRTKGFLNDYQQVTTLKSGEWIHDSQQKMIKKIDYVYRLYRRDKSR